MENFKDYDDSSENENFVPRDFPYTGTLDGNLPFIYSVPFKEDYVEENMAFYVKQLNDQISEEFNVEGLKPLCYTHFQGTVNDLFPGGVTTGLFQSEKDGELVMYSSFSHFLLEAKIYGGSAGKSDYIDRTTVDLYGKERRVGFLEIHRDRKERKLGNIEVVLREWSGRLNKGDFPGAEGIFEVLFNDDAFRFFAPKTIWDTPLKKNPLLVLTRKCLAAHFSQPTVKEKYPDIKF